MGLSKGQPGRTPLSRVGHTEWSNVSKIYININKISKAVDVNTSMAKQFVGGILYAAALFPMLHFTTYNNLKKRNKNELANSNAII